MKSLTVLVMALVCVFTGCATEVPPEVAAANAAEHEALLRAERNHELVVTAYDKQLRETFGQLFTERFNAEVAKLAAAGSLTEAEVVKLNAELDVVRDKVFAQLDVKLEEFRRDNNLTIAQQLNAKQGEFIKLLDDVQKNIMEIVSTGRGFFSKDDEDDDKPTILEK